MESTITRRTFGTFAGGSALAMLSAACPGARNEPRPPRGPISDRTIDDVIARALEAAKKGGATYADVRIVRRRTERIVTREDHVISVGASETYGIGVRVIAFGAWGFASSANVEGAAAEAAALNAVAIARAARPVLKRPVVLAPTPIVKGSWRTPTWAADTASAQADDSVAA